MRIIDFVLRGKLDHSKQSLKLLFLILPLVLLTSCSAQITGPASDEIVEKVAEMEYAFATLKIYLSYAIIGIGFLLILAGIVFILIMNGEMKDGVVHHLKVIFLNYEFEGEGLSVGLILLFIGVLILKLGIVIARFANPVLKLETLHKDSKSSKTLDPDMEKTSDSDIEEGDGS